MAGTKRRTALVTGANRGLGLETSRELAKLGFRVIATSRDGKAGKAGSELEWRRLDVADPASIKALSVELEREKVSVDVLVNNAGIYVDDPKRTIDVNFFGPLHLTDALLPRIPNGGSVVMVSSGMGEISNLSSKLQKEIMDPRLDRRALLEMVRGYLSDGHEKAGWPASPYRVSKAVLNALVRVLDRELRPRKIRVNAVCPGWVRTDMGGKGADRSVEAGARSIVATAALEDGPSGGFFRDGEPIDW